MAKPRRYSSGDRAALILLSDGTCYWPGCTERFVTPVNGQYFIGLQIAHIRALESKGARYDPSMSDEERNAFPNLIFLCKPHHTAVDNGGEEKYPMKTLQKWKSDRETSKVAALRGLRDLTEDRLQELITDAFVSRGKQIEATLARLEQRDEEAAGVMRGLVDELAAVRAHGSPLNPDTVEMFSDAVHRLPPNFEDAASWLQEAANGFGDMGLADAATQLLSAAIELRGLPDKTNEINEATNDLRSTADRLRELRDFM